MRQTLPALAAALLAALGLYGLLAAFGRDVDRGGDPWLDAWTAAGMRVEVGILTSNPGKDLLFVEGRALFGRPEAAGATIREYRVDDIPAQVVTLPSPAALPELPEGKHAGFKLRPKGGSVHLCRKGPRVLLLSMKQGTAMFRSMAELVPVKKAFDAFEAKAAALPPEGP